MISRYFVIALAVIAAVLRARDHAWIEVAGLGSMAAGLTRTTDEEERDRRTAMKATSIPGRRAHGSSTFQSFARGDAATEVDWLNGEIVLLGRLHGVPTPVNERLQRLARESAARGLGPRSVPIADVLG